MVNATSFFWSSISTMGHYVGHYARDFVDAAKNKTAPYAGAAGQLASDLKGRAANKTSHLFGAAMNRTAPFAGAAKSTVSKLAEAAANNTVSYVTAAKGAARQYLRDLRSAAFRSAGVLVLSGLKTALLSSSSPVRHVVVGTMIGYAVGEQVAPKDWKLASGRMLSFAATALSSALSDVPAIITMGTVGSMAAVEGSLLLLGFNNPLGNIARSTSNAISSGTICTYRYLRNIPTPPTEGEKANQTLVTILGEVREIRAHLARP